MSVMKAKTMLERMGFTDKDRKNPIHDNIAHWLMDNGDKIIKSLHPKISDSDTIKFTIKSEQLVKTPSGYMIGYVDAILLYNVSRSDKYIGGGGYIIEIKSNIDSTGDLLRQVNTYNEYSSSLFHLNGYKGVVVVSPDDRYIEYLSKNGILFYKYFDGFF